MQFLFSFASLFCVTRVRLPAARYLANRSHLPLAPSCAARALPACSPDRYFCFLHPCTTCLLARSMLLLSSAYVFLFCTPLPSNPNHITNSLHVLLA
jgi:hypothetical protein